ncbi:MAG: cell division protein FtsQ/DivIB [Rhodocyclaceae bacterium]|nr:cell division protein FtsQ/DivIB [Rhodocyclaceae bacterium]
MAKAKNVRKAQAEPAAGFWDKPVLMDLASDLLMLLAVGALAWAAALAMQRLPIFPLRQLIVATPVEQVSRGQIEHAAQTALAGNFFTVNLDTVRTAFEQLPWVRKASVRRRWPDGLELALEEQVAAARWQRGEGETQLVNTHGELFAGSLAAAAGLPVLAGPEGSAPTLLDHYQAFAQALSPLGRHPATVVLTARQAWELKLDDGVVVELGRDETNHPVADRLARFVAYYPAARQKIGSVTAVADMRYPNGFALRPQRKS